MGQEDKRHAATVFTFWGHCVRLNPVTLRKPSFKQQQKELWRSQELNKDFAKLKLNIRMYGWTSNEKKWIQKERGGK